MSLPVTAEPLPSSYTWGKVTTRIVHLIADTAEDTDDKPQARAAAGKVTFTPKEVLRKTTDASYPAIVLHSPESATLSSSGRILDAEGRQGIWLATGIYTVTFEIVGAPRAIPSFDIQVTAEHTDAAPLDLAREAPYVPPTGTVVQTIVVPSGGTDGQVLVRTADGGLVWATQTAEADLTGVLTTEDIDTDTKRENFIPSRLSDVTLRGASVAAVEEAAEVTPTGAWDFTGAIVTGVDGGGGGSLTGLTSATNTALGAGAGDSITSGTSNVALGVDALTANATGSNSVGIGHGALQSSTGVGNNVAIGRNAMRDNTTGDENVGIGTNALLLSTAARENTAVGFDTLQGITTGISNVAIGHSAAEWMSTGGSNTAVGRGALNGRDVAQITGSGNTGVGRDALRDLAGGTDNTAVGRNALYKAAGSGNSTAVGRSALSEATGGNNTAVGKNAGSAPAAVLANATTTGTKNTFLGQETGQASANPRSETVAVGYRALVDGDGAVALGEGAQALHAGSVALGQDSVTTATGQVMVGGRDVEITDTAKGLVIKSPDGTRYRVKVANGGALSAVAA